MKLRGKTILMCDCEHTMAPDTNRIAAALECDPPVLHTHLCRSQIDAFRQAIAVGEDVMVCCAQEAPLFSAIASESGSRSTVSFVDIRDRAGWSAEARDAHPKMAALIAEAALGPAPAPAVTLRSGGACLIYGGGDAVLAAARRLGGRLSCTALITDAGGALPPSVRDVALFAGRIRRADGHLGSFDVHVDGFAAGNASARGEMTFGAGRDGERIECDIIVDLSGGTPLIPDAARRDGYIRAEPSDTVAVERALFDAADLVGEFEKPRYVRLDAAICAHSRNGIVGCTKCLDVCPSGAATPAGNAAAIDPFRCSGHGGCASVCPTGAIVFDLPRSPALFERLRVLTRTYREAGGSGMVLLVHDPRSGDEAIAAVARIGAGLPARVVPFVVNEITMVGLDFVLTALAYGVSQVRILAAPEHRGQLEALHRHAAVADAIVTGLGYAGGRMTITECADPQELERELAATPPPDFGAAAVHRVTGEKRTTLTLALDHLYHHAPQPDELVPLPEGATFGEVRLHSGRCTLCLACVSVCPTAALGDNPDRPQLTFTEVNCVQCGLCRNTCPEDAITLAPRLSFAAAARQKAVLKEEEPFYCIRCGKAFGTQSTIDRLVARLTDHSMFAGSGRIDLIRMCEDCRVVAQFDDKQPMAQGRRPVTRTTDDDLREREQERRRAARGDRPSGSGGAATGETDD